MPAAAKGAYLDDGSALPLTMAMVLDIEVSLPLFQLHDVGSHRGSRVERKQENKAQSLSLKRAILKSKNLQFVPSTLLMMHAFRVRVCFCTDSSCRWAVVVFGVVLVAVLVFWLALNKRSEEMGILGVFVVVMSGF